MAKKYDAAGKDLFEFAPGAWLDLLGRPEPPDRVSLVDADLSATVTTAADKVIAVGGPDPWMVLAELHTYWDGDLPYLLHTRYALLRQRHRLPVTAVVVLMRPEADARAVTGTFLQPDRVNGDWGFPFHLIKLWERPVEPFLTGPLGLVPLAPLARIDPGDAPRVKAVIADRLTREAGRVDGERLRTCLFELLGLRYDEEGIAFWSDLMATLDFSKTYLAGLMRNEGRAEGRRETLLLLGTERFGPPSEAVRGAVEAMADEGELRRLLTRLLHVGSWDELLAP